MAGEGYPDAEALLVAWLKVVLGLDHIYEGGPTDVPSNVQYIVPLVMVERFGGNDDVLSLDRCNVDIDCYASDRSTAKALAERVRRLMRIALPRQVLAVGTVVTKVETVAAPTVLPYDPTPVRRVGAAYRLTVHHAI